MLVPMVRRLSSFATVFLALAALRAVWGETKFSPAERSITAANRLIDNNRKNFGAYNALALALCRRARETADVNYYSQAEEALAKSLAIAPGNFDGRRTEIWVLLGKHQFTAALEQARKLNREMPDDVMVYGFLTDANVELGNYQDAEKAAQWMLDLRPGNLPGLTRAAYLRELFGDPAGALELMNMALESSAPTEVEDAAWILTQMGHLQFGEGRTEQAERSLERALTLFPSYQYALGNLAKVRMLEKRYPEALRLLRERYESAPRAENLFDLAEALMLAGQREEGERTFAEFEAKSLLETYRADNSNRQLILYYCDHAHQPRRALEVAEREFASRQDVYTLDSYAWALHRNGQNQPARREIERALDVGVHDARLFRHAGEIALAGGDRAAAEKYLLRAAELNTFDSEPARSILANLRKIPGRSFSPEIPQ
ncbi:MAG: tetratricopeptide repeat protein [Acidobacteria bacterium]|nr:tetratricopeptide repeat protein [Acidobacteriota bacterium]